MAEREFDGDFGFASAAEIKSGRERLESLAAPRATWFGLETALAAVGRGRTGIEEWLASFVTQRTTAGAAPVICGAIAAFLAIGGYADLERSVLGGDLQLVIATTAALLGVFAVVAGSMRLGQVQHATLAALLGTTAILAVLVMPIAVSHLHALPAPPAKPDRACRHNLHRLNELIHQAARHTPDATVPELIAAVWLTVGQDEPFTFLCPASPTAAALADGRLKLEHMTLTHLAYTGPDLPLARLTGKGDGTLMLWESHFCYENVGHLALFQGQGVRQLSPDRLAAFLAPTPPPPTPGVAVLVPGTPPADR